MGRVLEKVTPGDPLEITAETFNWFIEAAWDYRDRQGFRGGSSVPATPLQGIVQIRNNSGGARNRYDILGAQSVLFSTEGDPEADIPPNVTSFKNRPALIGVTPLKEDHQGQFLVLIQPVIDGGLARSVASGMVPVQIEVTNENHEYADIKDNDATRLASAETGAAFIFWKETGIGLKWALVRLGNPSRELITDFVFEEIRAADPDVLWCVGSGNVLVPVAKPADLQEHPSHAGTTFVYNAVDQTRVATKGDIVETHKVTFSWAQGDVIQAKQVGDTGIEFTPALLPGESGPVEPKPVRWIQVNTNRAWGEVLEEGQS